MNPDVLLNRIRLEQRGLIDIHKKLYEMEHLLPIPDPMQFAKTAESAALLSEKSTAHLRNMFFSVSNEPPIYYYPKAAEVQGIRVWADTNYLCVLLLRCCRIKEARWLQVSFATASSGAGAKRATSSLLRLRDLRGTYLRPQPPNQSSARL
ncbi:MAG: hypothetical protein ACLRNA_01660 [Gemmiger formicilis]|uniref:hypothetical protein n=1 Tax=Gemmiger formicilis TaxID=745368 RepID=UPI003A34258C